MSIEKYVNLLSSQGEFQSTGSFTIGWDKALAKLKTFQAGDPEAFLLHLLAAGVRYGARNVTIKESSGLVELTMHDCYVSEIQVRNGFSSVVEGSFQGEAFDLALGLHSGLQVGYREAELSAVHPSEPSYSWRLKKDSEEVSTPLQTQEKVLTHITFASSNLIGRGTSILAKLFGKDDMLTSLGGYVGLSQACRLLDRRCELCEVPVTVNGDLVNRPFHLPRTPIAAKIGEPKSVKFNSQVVLDIDHFDWRGALVFRGGPLNLIVHGVSYPKDTHDEISGTIWADLNRDLARKRILKDSVYDRLMSDLSSLIVDLERAEDSFLQDHEES